MISIRCVHKENRIRSIDLRYDLQPEDRVRVRKLVEITGFFSPAEVDVAEELVHERLRRGPQSDYHFVMAEQYGRLVGYTCYGPIPCTQSSYDLYWIAVHPDLQGCGLGRRILKETERLIRIAGGTRIYAETSQRVEYAVTRAFYESTGYGLESVLPEFYGPGENKAVYCKVLI
jgi:GNAT superfamily N-acetyltransferase